MDSIPGALLVGAPGYRNATGATVGAVYAVFANGSMEVLVEGRTPLGEFGSAVAVDPAKMRVAIGSPAAGEGLIARGGRIDFFNVTHCQKGMQLTRAGAAVGRAAFARVGAAISWIKQDILVASAPLGNLMGLSPSARELGKVWVYTIPLAKEDMPQSPFYLEDSPYASASIGTDPLGRFGSAFLMLNRTLIIGAPRAKVDAHEVAGKVYTHAL